jgi:hypothetical protein
MQLQFLKLSDVNYFQHHHQMADEQWYQWMVKAQKHSTGKQFQQAQYYLGCCFDLANLMIKHDSYLNNSKLNAFEKLAVSGHGLAECLKQLNNKSRERHTLLATHFTLMKTLKAQENLSSLIQQPIEISCYMLKRHYCFYNEYEQISEVIEADKRYLEAGLVH